MPIDMTGSSPKRKITRAPAQSTATAKNQVDAQELYARRVNGMTDLVSMGQGLCVLAQQYADAAALGMHGPNLMVEVVNLAQTSEMIAKSVDWLITIGPYGGVFLAAYPLVMQILANHKVIDTDKVAIGGIIPPQVLEAQMKAGIAQQRAAAMLEQQEAIKAAEASILESERLMSADQMTVTHPDGAENN